MGNSIENFPIEIARAFSHRLCWGKFKVEIAMESHLLAITDLKVARTGQSPIADLKVAWSGQMPNAYPKMN